MKIRQTVAAAVIGLAGFCIAPAANAGVVFDNQNPGHVENGPPSSFITFTLSDATYITFIDTYHFNTPLVSDTFTIKDATTLDTVFSTTAITDPFGQPFDHWQATPNITLAAGTYNFYDAEVASWSYNTYFSEVPLPDCALYNCSNPNNGGFTAILSGPAPVPEPATWALMLAGFLGIGFLARGSRRKAPFTTA